MRMPNCAPLPVPTMTEVGVASPSAQGQAMMSTAIAFKNAYVSLGSGPSVNHTMNVTVAIPITEGTKIEAILSASRAIGGFEPCAS